MQQSDANASEPPRGVSGLVASHNEEVRVQVAHVVRSLGWEVREFSSGRDVLIAALADPRAVLLVDAELSGLDAFGLALRLASDGPADVRRLHVFTQFADSDFDLIADALGLYPLLTWPVCASQLLKRFEAEPCVVDR